MLSMQFCFDIVENCRRVMHQRMDQLDWNHLKAFLETAETGSLSAAARKLGLTQPTLSRQVAAIERQLGVTLFERVGKAMVPTRTGLALLDHARVMGSAADELRLAASGQSEAVDGVVSISATEPVAAYLLPGVLARLRQQAPGIVIEVVTSDALSDLQRREADIAVRHVRHAAARPHRPLGSRGHGLLLRLEGLGAPARPSAHRGAGCPARLHRRALGGAPEAAAAGGHDAAGR